MIVALGTDGAVVRDADDCTRLHLETDLDGDGLATALRTTGSGEPADDGDVWLDLAVLRSRAALLTTASTWPEQWAAMIGHARGQGWLSADGLSVRVHIERPSGQL